MYSFRHLIYLSFIFLLSCSDAAKEASEITTYPITVSVSGLEDGDSIQIVESQSGVTKTITADNLYSLPHFNLGVTYSIEVTSNPLNKRCRVDEGSGLIDGNSDVNVTILCLKELKISGDLIGLEVGQIIIRLKSGEHSEDLELSGSKAPVSFNFDSLLLDTDTYDISVLSYPKSPYQRCSIVNGQGVLNGTDVLDLKINCQLTLYLRGNNGITGQELFVTDGTSEGTFLVKNINTKTNSNPTDFINMGGVTYFIGTDGLIGRELWKTNGTANGTQLVKDINPRAGIGGFSNQPMPHPTLNVMGNMLYFVADDGTTGKELWKSDGSPSGTVLVKDFTTTGLNIQPENLFVANNLLYFTVGGILWTSDGNVDGTVPLNKNARFLTSVSNLVYFVSNDELWKTNGTPSGTVLVAGPYPGTRDSISSLTAVGNSIYFIVHNSTTDSELWMSDGNSTNTALLKVTNPEGILMSVNPTLLFTMGEILYFVTDDGTNSTLWQINGTNISSVNVKDINNNPVLFTLQYKFFIVGNKLFHLGSDNTNGFELWKFDTTTGVTGLVKDINPGTNSSYPAAFKVIGNTLYFNADDGTNGYELWKSEGDASNTVLVKNINPEFSSRPDGFSEAGGIIYFAAQDGTNGRELWRSDGTPDGTYLLTNIGLAGGGSNPNGPMVTIGRNSYIFVERGGNNLRPSIWRTDGTPKGTYMIITNINRRDTFTVAGNTLYFTTGDLYNNKKLWKSDGTINGARLVKNINPGPIDDIRNPVAVGNTLYFRANDGVTGKELWKTGGGIDGAEQVKDIFFGASSSTPDHLTAVGNSLYFVANDGIKSGLWKSDGTPDGTRFVFDINPNARDRYIGSLTAMGNTLYFIVIELGHGLELWKSDNTGTMMVKKINPLSNNRPPSYLTAADNSLYFIAYNDIIGDELWKSDGTPDGTNKLEFDINLSPIIGSNIRSLTAVGNALYFTANDGTHGPELWKSDSTGTSMVKDIKFSLYSLTGVNDTLYFIANDGINGNELWESDGTFDGTKLAVDLNPGPDSGVMQILSK